MRFFWYQKSPTAAATDQLDWLKPTWGPELAAYAVPQSVRYRADAPAQIHQGATVSAMTPLVTTTSVPYRSVSQLPRVRDVQAGPPSQQRYEFVPNQPDRASYELRQQALRFLVQAVPRLDGAPAQQRYEFVPNQPDRTSYELRQQALRYLVPAVPRVEGPISQQTSVFQPNQPELSQYQALQRLRGMPTTTPSLETTTAVVPVGAFALPSTVRYTLTTQIPRVAQVFSGAAPPPVQTDLFVSRQPDSRWFAVPDPNRFKLEAPLPIMELVIVVDTDPSATQQPEWASYSLRANAARWRTEAPKILLIDGTPVVMNPAPVSQPEWAYYSQVLNAPRRQTDPPKILVIDGTPVVSTYPWVLQRTLTGAGR